MATRAGSTNKRKSVLLARLQRDFPNYHPILELTKIANDPEADIKDRLHANKEVAKYVEPQLKAIEHTGMSDGEIRIRGKIVVVAPEDAG